MFPPCQPLFAFWSCFVLGNNVAFHRQAQGRMVPPNFTRKQYEESKWLQGTVRLLQFSRFFLLFSSFLKQKAKVSIFLLVSSMRKSLIYLLVCRFLFLFLLFLGMVYIIFLRHFSSLAEVYMLH